MVHKCPKTGLGYTTWILCCLDCLNWGKGSTNWRKKRRKPIIPLFGYVQEGVTKCDIQGGPPWTRMGRCTPGPEMSALQENTASTEKHFHRTSGVSTEHVSTEQQHLLHIVNHLEMAEHVHTLEEHCTRYQEHVHASITAHYLLAEPVWSLTLTRYAFCLFFLNQNATYKPMQHELHHETTGCTFYW